MLKPKIGQRKIKMFAYGKFIVLITHLIHAPEDKHESVACAHAAEHRHTCL